MKVIKVLFVIGALAGAALLICCVVQQHLITPTAVVISAIIATVAAVPFLVRQSHYSVYVVQLAALLWAAAVSHLGPHWVAEWLLWGGQVAILLILLIRVGIIIASVRKKGGQKVVEHDD